MTKESSKSQQLNFNKTKIETDSKNKITIDQIGMEKVNQYVYLGHIMKISEDITQPK